MPTSDRARTYDPPDPAVEPCVVGALAEDLLPFGDITTSLLPHDRPATGSLVARHPGVLAGARCVEVVVAKVDPRLEVTWTTDDGQPIMQGQAFATVSGPLTSILTAERTALNFLCHLSGVATLTRSVVQSMPGRTRVRDTRKTLPCLRALEKAAVRAGGGTNHRGSLSEAILVKDNHLSLLGVREAVALARERWPDRRVEIECDTLDQVEQAVEAGADCVLLDNMSVGQVRAALEVVRERIPVEASGGITLDNVAAYAATGVDFVAIGALTQSAPALDIGLDLLG